jgi:hypothetical protein
MLEGVGGLANLLALSAVKPTPSARRCAETRNGPRFALPLYPAMGKIYLN